MTAETDEGRTRARWTDLASLGFAMISAGAIIGLLAVLAFGLKFGDEGPFLVIVAVLPMLVLVLVRRFGTWAKVVGVVISLLAGLLLSWAALGIVRPNSFVDFMFAILIPPGAIIALVGCIAAIVAKRRIHLGARPQGGEARAIRIVLVTVPLLATLSLVATLATRTSAARNSTSTALDMKNTKFVAQDVSLAGGSKVYVHNSDPFVHTFTVDALGIDVSFGPGSAKLVDIPAKSGTYVMYCRLHTSNKQHPGKDDMAGTLDVT